jgi:hypothetical protein
MKKKIAVKFETNLFTKKINGISWGDMTRPEYSEAHCNGVLLYMVLCKLTGTEVSYTPVSVFL